MTAAWTRINLPDGRAATLRVDPATNSVDVHVAAGADGGGAGSITGLSSVGACLIGMGLQRAAADVGRRRVERHERATAERVRADTARALAEAQARLAGRGRGRP